MNTTAAVELRHAALNTAAGTDWAALWQALGQGAQPQPWLLSEHDASGLRAHPVPTPSLAAYGIDRKLVRTMEKQAQLCVVGAAATLRLWGEQPPQALQRTGLYLGLPSVDEDVPPISALERCHAEPREPRLAIQIAETPPFAGLILLNSSACAHIAGSFGLRGAMAATSPGCDAGLQSLIEGVLSVAEGENGHALIGAVAPKLHPLRAAQLALAGWDPARDAAPGEGAAFVMAMPAGTAATPGDAAPALRLAGYARGFAAPGPQAQAALESVLAQALERAGRGAADVGWVLPAACAHAGAAAQLDAALQALLGCERQALPVARVERATGLLGPAEPLVHVGLAETALRCARRLVWNEARAAHDEQPLGAPLVMLVAWAPQGQCVVALLELGAA